MPKENPSWRDDYIKVVNKALNQDIGRCKVSYEEIMKRIKEERKMIKKMSKLKRGD